MIIDKHRRKANSQSYRDDIQQWINNPHFDKSTTNLSNYAKQLGLISGPLSSLIVFPYAKDFGIGLARNILKTKSKFITAGAGLCFGISGTLSVSSLASYACSQVFTDVINKFYSNDTVIKSKVLTHRVKENLALGTCSFIGTVSAIPTSYLTYQYFYPNLKKLTMPLALFTHLTWSVVQTWSIYYLSEDLYFMFGSKYPQGEIGQRVRLVNKIESAEKNLVDAPDYIFCDLVDSNIINYKKFLEIINQYSEREGLSPIDPISIEKNKIIRDVLSYIGLVVGAASAYLFYPMGKQAASAIARSIGIKNIQVISHGVGISSFIASGLLSAYTTKDCFGQIYDKYSNLATLKEREPKAKNIINPFFLFLLSLSASAHRTTLTANYINIYNPLGAIVFVATIISLVCTNYWSIDKFVRNLHSSDNNHTYTGNKLRFFKTSGNIKKAIINNMSEEHVEVLNSEIEKPNKFKL